MPSSFVSAGNGVVENIIIINEKKDHKYVLKITDFRRKWLDNADELVISVNVFNDALLWYAEYEVVLGSWVPSVWATICFNLNSRLTGGYNTREKK